MDLGGIELELKDKNTQVNKTLKLDDEFYTVKEIAIILKSSIQYVKRLINLHDIEHLYTRHRPGGNKSKTMVSKSEFLRLIEILKSKK